MNRIYCSVRRAPVAEDIPDDPVVALLREEGDGRLPFMRPARATRPIWREVAPHRKATTCEDFAVRRAHGVSPRTEMLTSAPSAMRVRARETCASTMRALVHQLSSVPSSLLSFTSPPLSSHACTRAKFSFCSQRMAASATSTGRTIIPRC